MRVFHSVFLTETLSFFLPVPLARFAGKTQLISNEPIVFFSGSRVCFCCWRSFKTNPLVVNKQQAAVLTQPVNTIEHAHPSSVPPCPACFLS